MVYWFFGFPGTGKDYAAKALSELKYASYVHIDDFLTKKDKEKLTKGNFSTEDRLRKLTRAVKDINGLVNKNKNVVAADSLPDHRSRNFLIENFKDNIAFIRVVVSPEIHKQRFINRKNHFFTEELLDNWVKKHWQEPIKIPHIDLDNNEEGIKNLKLKLQKIL